MKLKRLILFISTTLPLAILAQPRFPKPEFDTGHVPPDPQVISPRVFGLEMLDLAVLIVLLSVMTWFVLKKRSRRGIFWTSIVSIIYFGFYKVGCVCSVGSVQNVTMSLFQFDYIIPITIIGFFAIPLIFTLFFGRTFCAGVCFMGAVQDIVHFKTVKVPLWLQKILGTIPYLYLVFAILFAATGSDFIICRYDPFIGFFRFNTTFNMFIFGALIIITSIFIGRPYCRFLCPYGVLLNWMSRLSKWHTTVTPTECIQCKLCEDACHIDAIKKPQTIKAESNQIGTKRLTVLVVLIPLFIFFGGFIVSQLYKPLSTVHPTVKLAEEINYEIKIGKKTDTEESKAFHKSGMPKEQLFADAAVIQSQFHKGSWIAGGFLGLFFAIALISSSVARPVKDYTPHRGNCVSCGKCYKSCPVDKQV